MTPAFFLNFLTVFFLNGPTTSPDTAVHEPIIIQGSTMGTTYRIIYFDTTHGRNFSSAIDSLLRQVNKSINTYDPNSEISKFNESKRGICVSSPYLLRILRKAKEIHRISAGAFDPTVMPLVNAWGFGPAKAKAPTARDIDSLTTFIGLDKVKLSKRCVRKSHPAVQLDMGGIGQGFGADIIYDYLRAQGIENMLVELGGEGVAMGINLEKNRAWTIGILNPNSTPENQFFKAYVKLGDRAFTTSGNYFNYKVVEGRKMGHTIDPRSGYPVQHSLLSASVFAPDCTTADGLATAFMVMGTEKAIETAKTLKNIDVLFIYSGDDGSLQTYISPGLNDTVTLE